jgi:hypothetical protein
VSTLLSVSLRSLALNVFTDQPSGRCAIWAPNEAGLRENQRAFRAGNERLNAVVDAGDRAIPFLCECADETCMARVEITGSAYSDLHSEENVFVIVSDHPVAGDELVVREFGGYQVVRA